MEQFSNGSCAVRAAGCGVIESLAVMEARSQTDFLHQQKIELCVVWGGFHGRLSSCLKRTHAHTNAQTKRRRAPQTEFHKLRSCNEGTLLVTWEIKKYLLEILRTLILQLLHNYILYTHTHTHKQKNIYTIYQ